MRNFIRWLADKKTPQAVKILFFLPTFLVMLVTLTVVKTYSPVAGVALSLVYLAIPPSIGVMVYREKVAQDVLDRVANEKASAGSAAVHPTTAKKGGIFS